MVSSKLKKNMTLITSKLEPAIWSHDTGYLTLAWTSNLKD